MPSSAIPWPIGDTDLSPAGAHWHSFAPFGISLALGCLIGLERERSSPAENGGLPGGIRTFPLLALLGCTAAWLGEQVHLALFVTLTGGIAAIVVMAYFLTGSRGDIGMTTEVAALLTYVYGAMTYRGHWLLAAGLAVGTTVILSLRRILHDWVRKISEQDLYAALQLAVISIIVLPLLPDVDYGWEPFRLFNPYRTWLIVVLISAVGFLGYVGLRVVGPRWGLLLTGLLGGLVSSTAVTLALSARAREQPELLRSCAMGIGLSWAAMGLRVLVAVGLVHFPLLLWLLGPVGLASLIVGLYALAFLRHAPATESLEVVTANPFSLWSAIRLAGLFVLVLLAVRFAQLIGRESGLLTVALLAGTTDMDAITLSVAQLTGRQQISSFWATLAITLAVITNTVVKTVFTYTFGHRKLAQLALVFATLTLLAAICGLGLTFFLQQGLDFPELPSILAP
ncbi:MAG: MgtC/SapB family protein [Gemmatales bacterium]|nr:MgtC/SapB family protein [Gemmatales bacterium]MDW7994023.1 MgtC/SapB family protein [Gemmatales bacterium]